MVATLDKLTKAHERAQDMFDLYFDRLSAAVTSPHYSVPDAEEKYTMKERARVLFDRAFGGRRPVLQVNDDVDRLPQILKDAARKLELHGDVKGLEYKMDGHIHAMEAILEGGEGDFRQRVQHFYRGVIGPFAGLVLEYELIQRHYARGSGEVVMKLEKPFASQEFVDYAMKIMLEDLETASGGAAFEHARRCIDVLRVLGYNVSQQRGRFTKIRTRRKNGNGSTSMILGGMKGGNNGGPD